MNTHDLCLFFFLLLLLAKPSLAFNPTKNPREFASRTVLLRSRQLCTGKNPSKQIPHASSAAGAYALRPLGRLKHCCQLLGT